MFRARTAIVVLVSALAVVTGTGRAFATVDLSCAIVGTIALDPLAGEVHIAFAGVTDACSEPEANGVTVSLDGLFSCATSDGTGDLAARRPDGVTSKAPTVIAASSFGIATIGTVASGPYEGDDVSAMLAVAAPVDSCTSSRATGGPSTGILYLGPHLLGTGQVPEVEQPLVGDPWSTKDETDNTVDHNFVRCAVPGDMYSDGDHSACKYDQAWAATRCTRTRQVSTGGSTSETTCTQKQLTQFAYRGGTANTQSPKRSGRCALGGVTDTEEWHLFLFRVERSRDDLFRYTAPSTHYGWHDNCDVEGQRFYGNPTPITMDEDHRARFVWGHVPCGRVRVCTSESTGFESTLIFGIGVPS